MVYALRQPAQEELADTYANYPVIPDLSPLTRQRYVELLQRLEPYRRMGRLLDAGSGSGYFLDTAMAHGWEAHGTEYDAGTVAACRQRGIHMEQGLLDPRNYTPRSFDVITSFEVMEHLLDPGRELASFVTLLRPGGVLYLTTPNFNSVVRHFTKGQWNIINYPEHLNYFTPRTLSRLLKDRSLQVCHVRTTGVSFMRLRNSIRAGGGAEKNHEPGNSDQILRNRIEGNRLLRLAKAGVNGLLTLSGSGDTIKVFARQPG